jgi:hypothetical protein
MIDGSTSGSEIQQLKNNNPYSKILGFYTGRYFTLYREAPSVAVENIK